MAKKKDVSSDCCGGDCSCGGASSHIAIPCALAGIYTAILVLFLIFARDQLEYAVSVLWGFVLLGTVALVVSYKSEKNKLKK